MPFPKFFKRRRTTSVVDDKTKSRGEPSSYSHISLAVPLPELRFSTSMPQLVLPENGLPISSSGLPISASPPVNAFNNNQPPPVLNLSIPADSKLLPPTPASPQVSPARSEVSDDMGQMWRNIGDRSANVSKAEKIMNKISDTASGAVDVETSTDGVVGFVKTVLANDEVKAIGNTILEGVPAIMSALETLTEIHPFLKAAYLPFKLIYHQETQRRDNDNKRTTLFGTIKDVMFILLELKGFGKDDTRSTPEGKPVLSRLASICKDMKKDIEECYNVLNAQERRSVGIKFLKASAWNKELGSYAARFTNRREELTFALSMRTVVTMEEMNANMKTMMEMFSTMLSPQERDMGRWINQNGGEKAVLRNDKKCAAMIKYEASLAPSTGPVRHADNKGPPGSDDETKAIAALRKEYREDIQTIIQENLESYSKRFAMGLDDLGKDLGNKIQHQGDRLIKYLRGGPHQRIKDKMVYRVWKDQGWKGSAKTRPLVLALRDYFVERVEHSKLLAPSTEVARKRPVSTVPKDEDNDDDPETDISVPLPDHWMAQYLRVKRLRFIEQALDPDSSGFTTISEINAFTHARPEDWSFPRWISYWAIGWQIYATKYCVEIEELFGQMMLLKAEIAIKMPGNLRYVNDYIEGCWPHVTVLTSSIVRYDSNSGLEEKFAGYVQEQEKILKDRLEKIQYDIDAIGTVSLVLRGERIEGSIFTLLALLLRKHVAKMHLCLKQEFDSRELSDDIDTVIWVVYAVFIRFLELKEQFQHREIADLKLIFEWLSCGLFKNYWEWQHWLQAKYFMENDKTVWTSTEIKKLDPADLKDILSYTDTARSKAEDSSADKASMESPAPETPAVPASSVPTIEVLPTNEVVAITEPPPPVLAPPSEAEISITGTWYGWHWTEASTPFLAVTKIDFKCGERRPESVTEVKLTGGGRSENAYTFALTGTLNSADQPAGSLGLSFERTFIDDGTCYQYNGIFLPDNLVMTGTFEQSIYSGGFLFKKVPESSIMCARPITPVLNAKELWAFAISAVVNEIRRKKPSPSYLYERMTNMHRTLGLMYDDNLDLLDEDEQLEYSTLLKTFSYEQMDELYKLYDWYDRAGDLQPTGYKCDGCAEAIFRSRVVCLDCVSTDRAERTVDFCSKPECIAMTIPHRTDVKHLPSHLMVRLRDLLLLRDYYGIKQRAGYSLSYARDIYKPDLSLTLPLPASPIIDNPSSFPLPASPSMDSPAKVNGYLTNDQMSLPAIVDDGPTPIPVNTQKLAAPPGLPALDMDVLQAQAQALDSASDQSAGTARSEGTELLSAAVTPGEEELNCIECHQRVLAPCWNCMVCHHAWVCDSCEKATNGLHPWDYVKRYRSEIKKMGGKDDGTAHTVLHAMVRVVGGTIPEVEPDAADAAATDLSSPLGQWGQIEKRIQDLVTERFEAVNATVERRLDGVDTRLGDVDKRLTEVETRLTTRLENIERLLNLIVRRETKS
ncbi:hypothetical protein DFH08DRAFT_754688 [Mycena albidolilacea]|uniref:Uncharacterized protein n=1 Tax=Mycena albidolilacea TaxID=1033008 RepID=A0AAD7EEZ6_9AGAR|nr:hypothetical protein DFH08DRAFT_754688 [Mycena albidolilacea]